MADQEDMAEWLCDSNDALSLQLVRSSAEVDELVARGEDLTPIEPFFPSFTYPIFGEHEKIFGYRNLSIELQFASGSLRQFLRITYDERLESTDTPADDVEGTIYRFVPPDYTKSERAFEELVEGGSKGFKPLGERIGEYTKAKVGAKGKGKAKGKAKGRTNGAAGKKEEVAEGDAEEGVVFEMYKSSWSTPGFREYHRRMQLFILLFIEGGSYVHEDEDAWEFVTLFERRPLPRSEDDNETESETESKPETPAYSYHFVGYTSVYPFWCYPDRVRLRLSQFVILPPYQQQGHGSALYSALYQHVLGRAEVAELTVEDPAEAFEDLRDRNDLRWLVKEGVPDDPLFREIGSKRADRVKWERDLRTKYKIAQRQFDRLLEMLLLRQLDRKDAQKVRAYRLHVKARLYRFNYEMLSQMTPEERKDALAKTYESVIEDYDRILAMSF